MTKKTFLKRLISLSLAFCFTLESSAAAIPPLDTLNGQTNLESTQISAIANPETSHPVAEREKDISVRSLDELLSSDAVTIDTADHATIVNTNIDNFTSEEILKLLGINVQFISAKGNPSLKKNRTF